MGVVFLAILFVILIPFAEGGLLALMLRGIHLQHPLPISDPILMETEPEASLEDEPLIPEESAEANQQKGWFEEKLSTDWGKELGLESGGNNVQAAHVEPTAPEPPPAGQPADLPVSVFDGDNQTSNDVPVDSILNSMLGGNRAEVPQDFESRVAETEPDADAQLQQLEQEHDQSYEDAELEKILKTTSTEIPIEFNENELPDFSPMAKELLGKDFDFNSLKTLTAQSEVQSEVQPETQSETQSKVQPALQSGTQPEVSKLPATSLAVLPITFSIEAQELEPGVFQASASPFITGDLPELSALSAETVISSFPDTWVQEADTELDSADVAKQYSFTEESRPMLVRKKKKSGN
jgi:hypothetical protein